MTNKAQPIMVVGSANVDFTFRLDRLPKPGDTVFGSSISKTAGGKGLNQAVACQRASGNVSFVYSTGQDDEGDFLEGFLAADEVTARRLSAENLLTGRAHIYVSTEGENQIVVMPGANLAEHISEVEFPPEEPGYLVLQLEIGLQSTLNLARRARASGWKVALTPAPVSEFSNELLAFVDVLMLNSVEAMAIAQRSSIEEAGKALAKAVPLVVVTSGSEGVDIFQEGSSFHVAASSVKAVDTTGAGDTFAGYFITALAEGKGSRETAEIATLAAGLSVQVLGASTSIPTRDTVEALR